jgi:phage baseplate assembly protein W
LQFGLIIVTFTEELAKEVLSKSVFTTNLLKRFFSPKAGSSIFLNLFVVKPEFLSLPLSFDMVLQKQDIGRCSLIQSVYQHIHLILTTTFGEMTNDSNYGCWVWENDFDNLTSNNKIREQIKQSLIKAVQQYETRIKNVRVEVLIRQEEQFTLINGKHVKKMLDVTLSAFLVSTKEPIVYKDRFFTGPLSY